MHQLQRSSPQRRWIVNTDENDDDSESNEQRRQQSSTFFGSKYRDMSSRQVNLHSYNSQARSIGYVETKIGGHPLDHKRILVEEEGLGHHYVHIPLKTATRAALGGISAARMSPAYAVTKHDVLVYAVTKIGGHALDHVPFINRGQPSRPLLGYVGPQPRTIFQRNLARPSPSTNQYQRIHSDGVTTTNVYDCSRCLRLRQSPRVHLRCGHPVCSSCLSSPSLQHVEHRDTCFVDCAQCHAFVAVETVVFSTSYVVRLNPPSEAALAELAHDEALRAPSAAPGVVSRSNESSSSSNKWMFGALLGAMAYATRQLAPKLASHKNPKVSIVVPSQPPTEEDLLLDDIAALSLETAASADRIANGRERWAKRVHGLKSPSKLLKFEFVETLGVGNFAEVMLVRNRKGRLSVLKESDKLQEAVNEIRILSTIYSPHVVRIWQYFVEEVGHRNFAYIEMEYCDGGDLMKLLKEKGPLESSTFDSIFCQLCLGLREIHRCGIVHRDLKPGNVLLTRDGIVKIADFGVSTCLESDLLTHHVAGTLAFMAPEVRRYFLGEEVGYNTKADVWSLGGLAVAMLTGNPEPRVATRPLEELLDDLREKQVADKYLGLLQRMLDPYPDKRPSLEELLEQFPLMNAKL